jgi:predicted Zn-dependent peptidase
MLNRAISPEITDFQSLSLPLFEEATLPNGIKLLALDAGDEAVTRTALLWRAGMNDVASPAALKLMTQMLAEGCGNRSGKEVSDLLESNGAWFKGAVTQHSLFLTLHCLNNTAGKVFPLLGEIISQPTFPADALESLKQKAAAEKEVTMRKPSYQACAIARQALYGESHPMAAIISPTDILAARREELVEYHRGIMLANLPTLFISGKITPEIKALICNTIGKLSFNLSAEKRIERDIQTPAPFTESKTVVKNMPDSLQSGVRLQIPTLHRDHPDFDALRFVTVALGGYFGSRLMSNIREDKGYTYGINANLVSTLEGGSFVISCECDNRYVDAVIHEINNEIERIASEEMTEEELLTVRNVLVSALAGVLDSPFTISSYRELIESFGITPAAYVSQFHTAMTMTPARVLAIARRYLLHRPAVTAIAGPR